MAEQDALNVFQRLLLSQRDVASLDKDVTVGGFGGGYAGISGDFVVSACRQVLRAHGIAAFASVTSCHETETTTSKGKTAYKTDVTVDVTFVNVDDPSDRFVATGVGSGIDFGDKAPGKATTYAKKYALMGALLMTTKDDDEGRPGDAIAAPELRELMQEANGILSGPFFTATERDAALTKAEQITDVAMLTSYVGKLKATAEKRSVEEVAA